MGFDAITVAPYMGHDSVKPFLDYPEKWTIVLALTSNPGGLDFQLTADRETGKTLYQQVIEKVNSWGTPENTMYVVGATRGELFSEIRRHAPNHFLLVPGVGAQGGACKTYAASGLIMMLGYWSMPRARSFMRQVVRILQKRPGKRLCHCNRKWPEFWKNTK